MQLLFPFHLAIPVHDLSAARAFYGGVLGCEEGRSDTNWVDFNLYGHQLVCHLADKPVEIKNKVDSHAVPIPHFGVVLDMNTWWLLRDKLIATGVCFIIEPYIRFEGAPGEQATMFFYDPSGNAIEFKAFKNIAAELFKK